MHRHASNLPERVRIEFPLETLTVQSEAASCEINNIMAKYEKTGMIDHVKENGQYVDLPNGIEYHDAMNLTLAAQQSFAGLPAQVRKEFDNDPTQFLAFVENPENVARMGELGLLNEPQTAPEDDAKASVAAAEGDATKSEVKQPKEEK